MKLKTTGRLKTLIPPLFLPSAHPNALPGITAIFGSCVQAVKHRLSRGLVGFYGRATHRNCREIPRYVDAMDQVRPASLAGHARNSNDFHPCTTNPHPYDIFVGIVDVGEEM